MLRNLFFGAFLALHLLYVFVLGNTLSAADLELEVVVVAINQIIEVMQVLIYELMHLLAQFHQPLVSSLSTAVGRILSDMQALFAHWLDVRSVWHPVLLEVRIIFISVEGIIYHDRIPQALEPLRSATLILLNSLAFVFLDCIRRNLDGVLHAFRTDYPFFRLLAQRSN